MRGPLKRRIALAFGILRGHPTMYRVEVRGGSTHFPVAVPSHVERCAFIAGEKRSAQRPTKSIRYRLRSDGSVTVEAIDPDGLVRVLGRGDAIVGETFAALHARLGINPGEIHGSTAIPDSAKS